MVTTGAPAQRARSSCFVAVLMLLVMWPAAAFAAGATFSARAPKPAASLSPSRATVSVSVYESHGVRGSGNYSMSVDGVKVRASIVYARSGDYRRFRITFKPTKAWRAGKHAVVVRVRDRRGTRSTTRWSFMVKASTVDAVTPLMALSLGTQPPASSCDLQPSYIGTATIVLNPPVGGRAFYRLDGGPVIEGTTIVVAPPATGFDVHNLTFILVDGAGNAGAPLSGTFIVEAPARDVTPPSTVSDPELAYELGVDLALTASDDFPGTITTYWRVAGSDQTNQGSRVVLPALTEFGSSITVVEYWSVDAAGNEESHHTETVARFLAPPVSLDTVAPVTRSDARGAYAGTATITLTATDDSAAPVTTCWSLDGGPVQFGRVVVVPSPIEPEDAGEHTLEFWSVDAAGNQEAQTRVSFLVEYDRIIIIDPPSHTVFGSCISIPDCHPSDARQIHRITGCRACHGGPVPLSAKCLDCHVADPCVGTHDYMRPQTWSDAKPEYSEDATIRIWSMDRSPFPLAQVLGSGVAVTYVRIDGGSPTAYTDLANYIVLDIAAPTSGSDSHTLEFWSVDERGNEEFAHNYVDFEVHAPYPPYDPPEHHLPATGCTATDCHPTHVIFVHYTTGCAACHAAGVESTSDCSACHTEADCAAMVDTMPPVTRSDAKSAYIGAATIHLWSMDRSPLPIAQVIGSGVAVTYVRVDGGAPTAYTALGQSITITVPAPATGSRQHTLEFWSVDLLGNVEVPHNVAMFTVEADAPISIPGSGLVPDGVSGGYARFRIVPPSGMWPQTSAFYRVDGGPVTAGTTLAIALPASGVVNHSVTYWWVDASGNAQPPCTQSITLTPDYTGGSAGPV